MSQIISKARFVIHTYKIHSSKSVPSVVEPAINTFFNTRRNCQSVDVKISSRCLSTKNIFTCIKPLNLSQQSNFTTSSFNCIPDNIGLLTSTKTPVFNSLYSFYSKKADSMAEEKTARREETTEEVKPKELTGREKLKLAVKEYGTTVIVFHIGMALMSLGTCYVLVSSGVDMVKVLTWIGISDETTSKLAGTSGTFVVAYAIHKLTAPVRMSITLGAAPFIVRHLRQKGWIRKP